MEEPEVPAEPKKKKVPYEVKKIGLFILPQYDMPEPKMKWCCFHHWGSHTSVKCSAPNSKKAVQRTGREVPLGQVKSSEWDKFTEAEREKHINHLAAQEA